MEKDDELVVGLVGLQEDLRSNGKGRLERCALKLVKLTDPAHACRFIETIAPDALVLDARQHEIAAYSRITRRLVQLCLHRAGTRAVPLVVLKSPTLANEALSHFAAAGATILGLGQQSYRHIGEEILRLCERSSNCCRGDRTLTKRQPARHTAVTRDR